MAEVERIAFRLAREAMTYNEPIPDFSTRYPNILESCVAAPFQTFGKKYLHRGFTGKAAMLFYLMTKNHPFKNGNKRIAMATLFVLLFKNRKWMRVDATELYNTAMWVASSPAKMKKETIMGIERFLKQYVINGPVA